MESILLKTIKEADSMPAKIDPKKVTPEEQALLDNLDVKIAAGKIRLYEVAPELARILSQLNIRVVKADDKHIKTMAVDPFGNIYINPAFGAKLTDDEFFAVFAHEALHVANGTFFRQYGRHPTLWNIATDAIMNWGLARDGYKLPKDAILPDVDTGATNLGVMGKISVLDKDNYPLSAEEIYAQLVKNREDFINSIVKIRIFRKGSPSPASESSNLPPGARAQKLHLKETEAKQEAPKDEWMIEYTFKDGTKKVYPYDPNASEGGNPGEDIEMDIDPDAPMPPPEGDPTDGGGSESGPQKPGKSGKSGKPNKSPGKTLSKEQAEAMAENYIKRLDNKTDKHLTAEEAKESNEELDEVITPERQKELEQQRIDDLLKGELEADRTATPSRGTGVGGTRRVLKTSIPIRVDWKAIIHRYLKAASKKNTTWLKPNYRGLAGGYQSPGRFQNADKLEAVFAVDTSGSIGTEELGEAFQYIKQIAGTVQDINVRICLWHSEAYYVSMPITSKGALEATLRNLHAQSGGTSISSIDPFLKSRRIRPVLVIYITDGYTEDNPVFGNYKKLFIIVNKQIRNVEVKKGIEKIFKPHGEVVFTPDLT